MLLNLSLQVLGFGGAPKGLSVKMLMKQGSFGRVEGRGVV